MHDLTIGNKLLTARRSTHLGLLQLTNTILDNSVLRKALERSCDSLESITFGQIELVSSEDS